MSFSTEIFIFINTWLLSIFYMLHMYIQLRVLPYKGSPGLEKASIHSHDSKVLFSPLHES